MLPAEKKHEFIRLRAEGKSYRAIEAEIGISRSTCSAWAQELETEIAITRAENLSALYEEYGLTKERRIQSLGQTLRQIDDALGSVDLSKMPPEKLLGMKLKYSEALRNEYTGAEEPLPTGGARAEQSAMFYIYSNLVDRLRAGNITVQQARVEMEAYKRMRGAYTVATTDTDFFGNQSTIELQPPMDAYGQLDDEAIAERRASLEAEEARQLTEAGEAQVREPTVSHEMATSAIQATLENLVKHGNVDGLMRLLEYTMEGDDDEEEDS